MGSAGLGSSDHAACSRAYYRHRATRRTREKKKKKETCCNQDSHTNTCPTTCSRKRYSNAQQAAQGRQTREMATMRRRRWGPKHRMIQQWHDHDRRTRALCWCLCANGNGKKHRDARKRGDAQRHAAPSCMRSSEHGLSSWASSVSSPALSPMPFSIAHVWRKRQTSTSSVPTP